MGFELEKRQSQRRAVALPAATGTARVPQPFRLHRKQP